MAWMCETLEVSASGYYAWVRRTDHPAELKRQKRVGVIEETHAEVKHRYGNLRMAAALKARGHECSENTVAELLREHGIRAKSPKRFVRTIDSHHRLPVAANLLDRDFAPARPNQSWVADIAYGGPRRLPTANLKQQLGQFRVRAGRQRLPAQEGRARREAAPGTSRPRQRLAIHPRPRTGDQPERWILAPRQNQSILPNQLKDPPAQLGLGQVLEGTVCGQAVVAAIESPRSSFREER